MKWNPFNNRIGLALGGGAAKGIAHIGVLKAFEEEGLTISCISGTSVGALVASYYAFGKPVEQIMSIGSTLNLGKMINFTWKKRGVFSTDSIKAMIIRDLGHRKIEDALIPLALCTTDIETGEQIIFRSGDLAEAICASMAVPGLFVPVEIGGRTLVDGGLVENVPVSLLEQMGAGITVGVDLTHAKRYETPADTLDVINNAIDIGMDIRTREQLKKADLVVPLELSAYNRTNNADRAHELYLEGYRAMKKRIKHLKWYQRTNLLHYLSKAINQLLPVKMPELFKSLLGKLKTQIDRLS